MVDYQLIRSARKSISVQIRPEGVVVRAPLRMSERQIRAFVASKETWIRKHLETMQRRQEQLSAVEKLTPQALQALAAQAKVYIPARAAHYAPLVGTDYGRITIRAQSSRWGSCSAKGNLNFNCLLMLAPPEVIDSVVVHELCHRKVMDHSPRFYAEVLRVFPEYHKWHGWLKEHGAELMQRLPEK